MNGPLPIVGIDLGTSNCVVYVFHSDGSEVEVIDGSSWSLPSSVYYKDKDSIIIGRRPEEMKSPAVGGFVCNWKEYLGLEYDSNKVIEALHSIKGTEVTDGQLTYTFDGVGIPLKRSVFDVATDYLTKLFQMKCLNRVISDASSPVPVAVGVPTSFSTHQKSVLKSVVKESGINNALFIEEPLAAVLSYTSLNEHISSLFLVCDIGMGVFRASLVQQEGNVFFLLGRANQDYLGANKINRLFLEYIEKRIRDSKSSRMNDCLNSLKKDSVKWNQMLYQVVNMKEALSESESYQFDYEEIHLTVLRSELETVIRRTIMDMIHIADTLLRRFNLRKDSYSTVLLMGRSCLLPRLVESFQDHFKPIRCSFLGRDAVAKGSLLACYYGSSITISKRPLRGVKELKPQEEEVLYPNNLLPEPISIRREDGSCRQLLHQNESLDTEAVISLHPLNDGQSIMRLDFCQGPSSVFSDNIPIGTIQYVPDQVYSKGDPNFKVKVIVDKRGVLSCTIMDPKTGKATTETLQIPRSSMTAPSVSTEMLEMEYKILLQEVIKLRRKVSRDYYSNMTYRIHVVKQKYTEGTPLDELIEDCKVILRDYDKQMTCSDKPPSFDEFINRGNMKGAKSFFTYNLKSKQIKGIIWNGSDATLVRRESFRQICIQFDPKEKWMKEYEQEWNSGQSRINETPIEEKDRKMKELPQSQKSYLLLDGNETWEGSVKDGVMHGYGILYSDKKWKKYEGFMWNGKKNGWGWLYYDDVELIEYDGCFYNDRKWGYGTMKDRNGGVEYCGYWMNDQRYSNGVKEEPIEICSQQNRALLCCSPDVNSFELAKWIEELSELEIKDMSFQKVTKFTLDGLPKLCKVAIGKDSFAERRYHDQKKQGSVHMDSACFRIVDCPELSSILIGDYSFCDYSSFELKDLPKLESIVLGENCFYRVPSISLTGMFDWLV